MKKYIGPVLSLASIGMLFYILFDQKQQINRLKQIKTHVLIVENECDSLKSEMIAKDIQLGRYEIIMERIDAEFDAECKEKIDEIKLQVE